ncbi:alpha/beta fold hydrolase [Microbispora sp. GKU 823]|uniref:alpha/beta fold hydrolase n=1 Tax=Microbispora sp. GKU 823 TaxID=1652100 RepID=UPI0021174AFC|nr:alpha/beta fold hydrolase [Microbispora sp. GKU 823]
MTPLTVPRTLHRHIDVGDVRVFYRESVPEEGGDDAPVMLLLHGFPSASHQFRRLIDVLGARYRLIAPDYPGFGHTEAPAGFTYSFDTLAEVMEGFVERLGLTRFVMYVFDFGAPVGFRLATRHPTTCRGARRPRWRWPSTTTPTWRATRCGRPGYANTGRRR